MAFDYVIVGAGSAGCVLANRLTEDPEVQVLLVEAGGTDSSPFIQMPVASTALLRTDKDWDHSTGYEPQCGNRRISLPRGRVLGGSSSINFLVYIRGNRLDYDGWRDGGCAGWGWEDMLPCFLRAEDNERGASDLHGVGGPLAVSDSRSCNPIAKAFIDAGIGYGLTANEDFNGPEQDGVGWYQVTERDGLRCSTAAGYLHPVLQRPNLHVETGVQVLKILFDGTRAVGVQGARQDEVVEFRATSEVIVSCGTYQSPQLLMLSGIGRRDELVALGITPVAELPGVGENLSDHTQCLPVFAASRPESLFGAVNPANLAQFQTGRGPLTSNGVEAGAFVRTRDGLDAPDVQLNFSAAMWIDEGYAPGPGHGFSIGASVSHPLSRGSVRLSSPDPTAKPRIVHNYLSEPDDLRAQIEGVRMVMAIARHEPLAGYVAEPHLAPASDADADLTAFVRARTQTMYHPVGTCRMGTDDLAVVDPELRVRGVDGLRVVDASVMPTVPRGNTNAPTIAVAERAADIIRGP